MSTPLSCFIVRARSFLPSRRANHRRKRENARGQSMVEAALILPILLMILAVVLEGGMALNAWLRVQTAARDATRFALDAGRPPEITSLVHEKLVWMDQDQLNIYLIRGKTNDGGQIPPGTGNEQFWDEDHLWGGRPTGATITPSAIQERLAMTGGGYNNDVPFVIVEVNYVYVPTFIRVLTGNARIPMTSYAIIHQY
jgi:hypothetical protein